MATVTLQEEYKFEVVAKPERLLNVVVSAQAGGTPGPAWITAWVGAFTVGIPYAEGNAGNSAFYAVEEGRLYNLTLRVKHDLTIPDLGLMGDLDYINENFDIIVITSNGVDGANGTPGSNGADGAPGQSVTVLSFANADVAGFNAAVAANAGNPLVFVVRRSA